MKVTLTTKDSTVETFNKIIDMNLSLWSNNNSDFFDKLNKEVISHPKQAKRLKKALFSIHTTLLLTLATSTVSHANPATPANPVPRELADSLLIVMGVIAALGVATAIITLMISGMWKMLFGKSRSDEWTIQIIKGLAQVVAAPIVVALIVAVFTLLFSNVSAFQPIQNPITTFFHH
ncbi:hypothetical protein [Paenibacillus pini]